MIGPDIGRVELDLKDGQPPLVLFFSNLAFIKLARALSLDVSAMNVGRIALEMKLVDVPTYLWAALLHADPKLKVETVEERFGTSRVPMGEVIKTLGKALIYGTLGESEPDEPEAKPNGAGPKKPTAGTGASLSA